MTTGTIHTLDAARGTGTLRALSGTFVPFSTAEAGLRAGDAVTFRLVGGRAGLYADQVEAAAVRPPRRRQRQTVVSPSVFLWRSGTVASSAG